MTDLPTRADAADLMRVLMLRQQIAKCEAQQRAAAAEGALAAAELRAHSAELTAKYKLLPGDVLHDDGRIERSNGQAAQPQEPA